MKKKRVNRFNTIFPDDVQELLEKLAKSMSVSYSAAVRICIIETCRERGITNDPPHIEK